jgi:hypothetical protein
MKAYAILMMLVAVSPVDAQETQVIGIGTIECCKTLERQQAVQNTVGVMDYRYCSELSLGHLDADSVKHDLRSVNLDTSSDDVDAYCARHPDEFVVNAAKDMYLKLPKM